MPAYSEIYVDDAMNNLGEAVDYAFNCCDISPRVFMDYFITSGIADEFGDGSPRVVTGMFGTELARYVLRKTFNYPNTHVFPPAQVAYDYSQEYWTGWILAYYQWKSGFSFRRIIQSIPMDTIYHAYNPLHETSQDRAAVWFDEQMIERTEANRLQQMRRLAGYTQKMLAEKSGVNLRTLQQYEIGTKDLKKASVTTVYSLSHELGCSIEVLLR